MIGLPTNEGKICAGKLEPAYPHLTKPVPLSQTMTFLPLLSILAVSCAGVSEERLSPFLKRFRSPFLLHLCDNFDKDKSVSLG